VRLRSLKRLPGIREYWIVDPEAGRLLSRSAEAISGSTATGEQAASGVLLAGFALTLADVWAELEEREAKLEVKFSAQLNSHPHPLERFPMGSARRNGCIIRKSP
jgi:hypothetical protein